MITQKHYGNVTLEKRKNIQCRNCIDLNRIITKDRVDVSFTKRSYSALPMASLQNIYFMYCLLQMNLFLCVGMYMRSPPKK